MSGYHRRLCATSALGFVLGLALPGHVVQAQQTAQGGVALEEITVTARRVEENIMTVPTSVSVMSDKDIESLNIKDITDLSSFSPGFYSAQQAVGNGAGMNDRQVYSLIFRGFPEAQSGSLFIDGAPAVSGNPPPLDSIARVEVLEGPQSAYFGRATFMGAINFITKDPNLTTFKGSVSAEYSSYGSNDESISLEGPLVADKLAVRIDARHLYKGGQEVNAADTSQRLGDQSTDSISGDIVFHPSDNLKIKGFVSYLMDDDGPAASISIKKPDGFFNCSFTGGTYKNGYLCGQIPTLNQINPANISGDTIMTPFLQKLFVTNGFNMALPFSDGFLDHFGLKRKAVQADLRMDYDTSYFTVSSLTSYDYSKIADIYDIDERDGENIPNGYNTILGLPNTLPYYSFDVEIQNLSRDWSQELRFTSPQHQSFRWMFGGDYIHNASPGSIFVAMSAVGPLNLGGITVTRTETPAVFGALYYDFLSKFTLSAEARYQWDKLIDIPVYQGNTLLSGAAAQTLESTFKSFSPRVSLDYKFTEGSMLYGLWSRGYRPGGFNTVLQTEPQVVINQILAAGVSGVAYKQEELNNFEGGIKSSFLDNRARVTLTVYYDRWTNGQITTVIPYLNNPSNPSAGGALLNAVVNSGRADLKGVEYTGELLVTKKLKLTTALAVNNTKIVAFAPCSDATNITGAPNCNGDHLPDAPSWTSTVSAEYSDHLVGDYDWFTRLDYNHKGKLYADYTNLAWIGASNIVNLQVGVETGSLTIRAFVKNLTNDLHFANAVSGVDAFTFFAFPATAEQNEIRLAEPDKRTFGINVKYNF